MPSVAEITFRIFSRILRRHFRFTDFCNLVALVLILRYQNTEKSIDPICLIFLYNKECTPASVIFEGDPESDS